MSNEGAPFREWCILEIMGHRRLGGLVTEATIAGAGFIRIDVPGENGIMATQFYRPDSVYGITPCGEREAKTVAAARWEQPVQRWELPEPPAKQENPEAVACCGCHGVAVLTADASRCEGGCGWMCEDCTHADNEGVYLCPDCWDNMQDQPAEEDHPHAGTPE